VSNRHTVLPSNPRELSRGIKIDYLQFSPPVKGPQTTRDSLYIARRLDVEARFLGEVDVLGASLSSDLVLEACRSNWSETLCQSILDRMNEFDRYEKKSSAIGTKGALFFIHNEFPASVYSALIISLVDKLRLCETFQ